MSEGFRVLKRVNMGTVQNRELQRTKTDSIVINRHDSTNPRDEMVARRA